jgi:hypothetical protein
LGCHPENFGCTRSAQAAQLQVDGVPRVSRPPRPTLTSQSARAAGWPFYEKRVH